MPGARRTAQSVLVVAVPVGALLRELPACGRGPADLVAAPSPEGSRPSGLGMPPAPESARCLPTPSGFWHSSRASSHLLSVVSRFRGQTRPGLDGLARPQGVPLKPWRKLSQASRATQGPQGPQTVRAALRGARPGHAARVVVVIPIAG
jgi:hypothetical protein